MFKDFMKFVYKKSLTIKDEIPIYCIIINENNQIISRSSNKVEEKKNACLHAEILALNKAFKKQKSKFLENCSLYVNLEPCFMCGYAISLARIKNVFFGASNEKFGFYSNSIVSSHKVNYFQLMEKENKNNLDKFFLDKRN